MRDNLFVYGTLKDPRFFEKIAGVRPENQVNARMKGKLYLAEWYPLLVLEGESFVYGSVVSFDTLDGKVFSNLDDYEGVEDGLFFKSFNKSDYYRRNISVGLRYI